jgi:hypothetical protein
MDRDFEVFCVYSFKSFVFGDKILQLNNLIVVNEAFGVTTSLE